MSQALRKILQNPFLKESPFRSHQNFYSTPLNYLAQSSYRSHTQNNYVDLSVTTANKKNINLRNDLKTGNKVHKKIQNPFFRKNLITTKYQQNFVQIQSTGYLDISSKIKTSNFFQDNAQRKNETYNEDNYRDLSYKTSTQCKRKSVCDTKIPGLHSSYKDIENGANYSNMNGNMISKKYLSPRFPSMQVIQGKQNNICRLSIQSPLNVYSPRDGKVDFGGVDREIFSSERKIYRNEKEPERDINQIEKQDRNKRLSKEIAFPNDGNPKEMIIRGEKYFKNFVLMR